MSEGRGGGVPRPEAPAARYGRIAATPGKGEITSHRPHRGRAVVSPAHNRAEINWARFPGVATAYGALTPGYIELDRDAAICAYGALISDS